LCPPWRLVRFAAIVGLCSWRSAGRLVGELVVCERGELEAEEKQVGKTAAKEVGRLAAGRVGCRAGEFGEMEGVVAELVVAGKAEHVGVVVAVVFPLHALQLAQAGALVRDLLDCRKSRRGIERVALLKDELDDVEGRGWTISYRALQHWLQELGVRG